MKKIILIIIAVVLIAVAGYIIKYSTTEPEAQRNISEEKVISKHEEHEEHVDDEHEHDHSVEIEGSAMKSLTVQEMADLWEIDAETLLLEIIAEFELQGNYTVDTILEEIREAEYKFSPAIIKDLAEEIKNPEAN